MTNLSLLSEPTTFVCHEWNGHQIRQRRDGWVCLTDMAQACGKLVGHYLSLKGTAEYLEALSAIIGIPITELVQVSQGGNDFQGTLAHPEVAIDFAQWASVEFRIWANKTLREAIPQLAPQIEAPTPEVQIPAYPPTPVLPPAEQRLATLMAGLEKAAHFGFDPTNPRIAQGIKDQIANILLGASTPIPTASTELTTPTPADEPPAERWGGVVEIALSMGGNRFAIDKVRTTLGRYVSDRAAALGLNRRQEERIVQGVACAVWLYQDCAALRSCITDFFGERNAKYLAPSDLAKLWKEQGGPNSANTCSLNRRLMHLGYQSREGGFTGKWVALSKGTKYTKVVKGELRWLPSILKKLG